MKFLNEPDRNSINIFISNNLKYVCVSVVLLRLPRYKVCYWLACEVVVFIIASTSFKNTEYLLDDIFLEKMRYF